MGIIQNFENHILKTLIECTENELIGRLHRDLKEFTKVLIVVASWLDAVVACINVLNPIENQWFAVFKLMLSIKYTGYINFVNNNRKVIDCIVEFVYLCSHNLPL